MSREPSPEEIAAFDRRCLERRAAFERDEALPAYGEAVLFSSGAPDALAAMALYARRHAAPSTVQCSSSQAVAPPAHQMEVATMPLGHTFEVAPEQVNAGHVVFGRNPVSGKYVVGLTPARRADLLGATDAGRQVLEHERQSSLATFAAGSTTRPIESSPHHQVFLTTSGETREEKRRKLLASTSLGRAVLADEDAKAKA